MAKGVDIDSFTLPQVKFTEYGGFYDKYSFQKFCRKHGISLNEDGEYNVMHVMRALNVDRKTRGLDTTEMDAEKKKEEVMKLRIANQEKIGKLVPIHVVRDRIRVAYQAVASKIRYAVKQSAPRLVGITDARLIEDMLTKKYNAAIDLLKEEAKDVDWEKEASTDDIGRTELAEDSREDSSGRRSEDAEASAEKQHPI